MRKLEAVEPQSLTLAYGTRSSRLRMRCFSTQHRIHVLISCSLLSPRWTGQVGPLLPGFCSLECMAPNTYISVAHHGIQSSAAEFSASAVLRRRGCPAQGLTMPVDANGMPVPEKFKGHI